MVKFIALLKRRPDMTPEQFRTYYEEHHVPLEMSILPNILEYRRNYAIAEGMFLGEEASAPDFDVVTEISFPDQDAADAAMKLMADPAIAKRVADDEEQFLDRPKTRMFTVQVVSSES